MPEALDRLASLTLIAMAIALLLTAVAFAQNPRQAWEYLQEPAFRSAYTRALGPKAKTPWLAKRDGPSQEDKFVQVAGVRYVMNAFCKNHDCYDHSAVLLYSPEKTAVYGTIYEKGKTTWIGDPPGPVATELAKSWKAAFRSQD